MTQVRPATSSAILVVDDDEPTRYLVSRVLAMNGYNVLEAEDGAHALQVARKHEGPIGLLLTDVFMPHLDGPGLAEMLKLERPLIRVLYTSAQREELMYGRLSGETVLWKPFTPDELLVKVRALLSELESQLEHDWTEAFLAYKREIQRTLELLDFKGQPNASHLENIRTQHVAEQRAFEKYRKASRAYTDFLGAIGAVAIILASYFR